MIETRFKIENGYNIPIDWEAIPLNNIGMPCMCKRVLKEDTSLIGDIPFFKIGTFGRIPDAYISRELFDTLKAKYNYPRKGDILISASGTIGRTVVFDGKESYFQDSNIIWLDNSERKVTNKYLNVWLQVIKWATTDGGTITRLYNKNIAESIIVVPPIEEQERIATAFSDINDLIFSMRKLIEKKKNIKQGVMQDLLSGKRRLKGFTSQWQKISFSEIYKYASEGGTPSTTNRDFYYGGTIPFVKIEDTVDKYITQTKSFINDLGLKNSSAWLVPKDSIILTNGATIGNVSITKIELSTKQGILGIILKPEYDVEFMYYTLSSHHFQKEMHQRESGGTFATVILKSLNTIEMLIPSSKDEQIAIAKVLSDMDTEIEHLESQLSKYEGIKRGMMQQLLTGKIRLI